MMDINCDMGEGMGNEEQLIPFINSANIACGYHAGNTAIMLQTIQLCLQHAIHIGAHPSFNDKENFGRKAMQLSSAEIYTLVTEQLKIINAITVENNAILHHVKPHGALYNMAAVDAELSAVIVQAVKDFNAALIYYGLSGSVMITAANKIGLQTANEVFADRTYQDDGTLTPRNKPNALFTNTSDVQQQVLKFKKENKVTTVSGKDIFMQADTVCIHGDGEQAVDFAKAVYKILHET
jgi:5-oxoprolinase (ATP-hydrolysing) subunit A